MSNFKPFENDSQSTTLGPGNGLTFENGTENIVVYGDFQINKGDTKKIQELIDFLQVIKVCLEDKKVPKQKK